MHCAASGNTLNTFASSLSDAMCSELLLSIVCCMYALQAHKSGYWQAGCFVAKVAVPVNIAKCFPAVLQQQRVQVQVHVTVDGADSETAAGGHGAQS
jgi:hypothetical protein